MLNNDSLNQYSWVMKVLDSCQNDSQVGTTEKFFELYKKSKLYKLKKKGQTFLSNISQFFLF